MLKNHDPAKQSWTSYHYMRLRMAWESVNVWIRLRVLREQLAAIRNRHA